MGRMMKTIVFTLFLVHSSWASRTLSIPHYGCISDFKYNLEVTLKRGETVCGKKTPIKEGWKIEEDRFQCTENTFKRYLDQPNETFDLKTGDSRIPTQGKYRCCLKATCVEKKNCIVTLTKKGGIDDLIVVLSRNGSPEEFCDDLELEDKDRIEVNLISIGNVDACLDTDEKDNNRLTCKLEEKLGDE